MSGFRCPECGAASRVIETRTSPGGAVRRRRICNAPACDTKFTTAEVIVSAGHRTTELGGRMAIIRQKDLRAIVAIANSSLGDCDGDT